MLVRNSSDNLGLLQKEEKKVMKKLQGGVHITLATCKTKKRVSMTVFFYFQNLGSYIGLASIRFHTACAGMQTEEKKVRKKLQGGKYLTLETRKDGTKFTHRGLRDAAESLQAISRSYNEKQSQLVDEVHSCRLVQYL